MTVEDYVNANKEAFTKDGRFAITSPVLRQNLIRL